MIRNKWINNQNKMAYRQEIENIRTMLNSGLADATTIEQLKKREADMKKKYYLLNIYIYNENYHV